MKRQLASTLLLLTVISAFFSSCTGKNIESMQTSGDSQSQAETESPPETDEYGRKLIESAVPEDLDFNGETFTVLLRDNNFLPAADEFIADTMDGEVVHDSIYLRNRAVEEDLNIQFNMISTPFYESSAYLQMVKKSVMAEDNAYDLLAMYAYYGVSLAAEGFLYNLNTLNYLDLEKPWWNQNFVDEMTLYDQLYFIVGDLSLTATQSINAMFFNKELAKTYFPDADFYKTVEEGKWTIDYFRQLIRDVYGDLNGDTKPDDNDFYAFGVPMASIPLDAFLDSMDVLITKKDGEGIPQLNLESEHTVSAYQKVFDLFYNTPGTLQGYPTLESIYLMQDKFERNEMIFLMDIFHATNNLREMQSVYGVLPLFKFDEAQQDYYTNAADVYSLISVPLVCKNPEMTGAVLELLGEKSYKFVTPAYFEVALKQKYTRDNIDAQMYDKILAQCRYNFGFVYSNSVNNVMQIWRACLSGKKDVFVPEFKKVETSVQKQLDKLVEAYRSKKIN